MRKTYKRYQYQRDSSLLKKVQVKYQRIRNKQKVEDEDVDGLVSADEELLGADDPATPQRVNGNAITWSKGLT